MADYVNLPGVPETITRQQYLDMIKSVGLEVENLLCLEFRPDGIYAEVYATDERGNNLVDVQSDEVVTHRVYIRVDG